MIDSLEARVRDLNAAVRLGLTPGEFLLVTRHRPALLDRPLLGCVFPEVSAITRELPVVFPAHSRTRKTMTAGFTVGWVIARCRPFTSYGRYLVPASTHASTTGEA